MARPRYDPIVWIPVLVATIGALATVAAAWIARGKGRRVERRSHVPERAMSKRVLVVEDRPADRHFMCAWLAGLGDVQVHGVATVAEADEEMMRGDVAVAVIDVGLPGAESGLDLARRRPGHVRVVLVSASVDRVAEMSDAGHGIEAVDKLDHDAVRAAVERALSAG